jgi:hypothetical protein
MDGERTGDTRAVEGVFTAHGGESVLEKDGDTVSVIGLLFVFFEDAVVDGDLSFWGSVITFTEEA